LPLPDVSAFFCLNLVIASVFRTNFSAVSSYFQNILTKLSFNLVFLIEFSSVSAKMLSFCSVSAANNELQRSITIITIEKDEAQHHFGFFE
jgi:hypothetical protein